LTGTSGNYLLDTNIVVPILNQDAPLLQRIKGLSIYVPVIVLGELYFGAQKSARIAPNIARIQIFKSRCVVVGCDESTAEEFGKIREFLVSKGKPIPENDIWIAAIALQHGLTLVTRDEHFKEVDGLTVEAW